MDILRRAISMPLLCRQDSVVNTHGRPPPGPVMQRHSKSRPRSFVGFRIKVCITLDDHTGTQRD